MLDKNLVKSWFVTKAKPVQNQFAQWIDASWFKGEQLAITDVSGLSDALLNSQLPIASTIALLNATDDIATFAGTQSTIVVKDQQRGGIFNKYTGADAVDGGLVFQDANSNKWKRQTQDGKINVAWFGILGDGTDESAKILAMFNSLSGKVHIQWNNVTYRFFGCTVPVAVQDLTMEFNNTTFCYPLRNSSTTPKEWYRFSDVANTTNCQLLLTNIPKIFFKGNLTLDGERRLGNSFNTHFYNTMNGTGAVVTPTISGGKVTGFTINNGGSGFPNSSGGSSVGVIISGGGGTGAYATCTCSGGAVTAMQLKQGGINYTSVPTVTFAGGDYAGFGYTPAINIYSPIVNKTNNAPAFTNSSLGSSSWSYTDGVLSLVSGTGGYKGSSFTFTADLTKSYIIYADINVTSGSLFFNTTGTASQTAFNGTNAKYINNSTTKTGFYTVKFWFIEPSAPGANATINNIRVVEIDSIHRDTFVKTEGKFTIIDHKFAPLKVYTDNIYPNYNKVSLKDWNFIDTVLGGIVVNGFFNEVEFDNFYINDSVASDYEFAWVGENGGGIGIGAANAQIPDCWTNSVKISNIFTNFGCGVRINSAKKVVYKDIIQANWGKYIGGDGKVRNLSENTGSPYDILGYPGGQPWKPDVSYYSVYNELLVENFTNKDTSTLMNGASKVWSNLWFQSGDKYATIRRARFDSYVSAQGQGDYDPTSQSWAEFTLIEDSEFTEDATVNVGATRFNKCKFTRKKPYSGNSTDWPNEDYNSTILALYNQGGSIDFGGGKIPSNGVGFKIAPAIFDQCIFIGRNQYPGLVGSFKFTDCVFKSNSSISLRNDLSSSVFKCELIRCKRVWVQTSGGDPSDNSLKPFSVVILKDCEIVIPAYNGPGDLTNAISAIRKILDYTTYEWDNLKIYKDDGITLLHDLKGFQWIKEPTDVTEYGIEGTYYETDTKRWDYKSGGAIITPIVTGGIGKIVVGNGDINGMGAGYTTAPSVSITGGAGTGAAATAVISPYKLSYINVVNPGTGYSSVPTVTLTGGGGTYTSAVATIKDGGVVYIDVTGAANYTSMPTVTITGGGGVNASAVAIAVGGQVTAINVTTPGSGYTFPINVTLTGGGGSGVTTKAYLVNGTLTGLNIVDGGKNYVSVPKITFYGSVDTGGTNATATLSITDGAVTGYTVTNAGSKYVNIPDNKIFGGVQWTVRNKSSLLSASATLDYSSIAAGGSQDLTIPLTGAALGDTINIGLPASAPVGLVFNAFVSAADTITLRATNITGAAIDATSDTYKVSVVK